jgi:hypothetical protein
MKFQKKIDHFIVSDQISIIALPNKSEIFTRQYHELRHIR